MRLFWLSFFISFYAFGYQSSLNGSGKGLTWPNPTIPVHVRTNTSDMGSGTSSAIIQQSINEWNAQTGTQISISSSARNEISFKNDFSIYGPGVIGVTELTYTSGGSLQKAMIYLNDNYDFQSSPGLYSSGEVYLGDVVTHELGHLFGLSHSEVLDASMFYAAFSGQSTLSMDDKSGIKSKYGSGYGIISGKVKGGSDIGILGVHVIAFSRSSGESVGVISDASGNFSIKGLNLNDSYYIYTSPLKNLSSLPGQFANVQTDFCPASFQGGFFDACGKENEGFPQGITLTSSEPAVNVGDVTIHCGLKTNEDYNIEKLQSIFSPVKIFDFGEEGRFEKAFVGHFLTTTSASWSEEDVLVLDLTDYSEVTSQKYLRLNLLGRQFGNLLEYEMTVSRNGSAMGTYQLNYSVGTQTYSTDLEAFLPLSTSPSNNVFEVLIRARKLPTVLAVQTFPDVEQFLSQRNLPYLLVASMEDGEGPLLSSESNLSDNASCLDAPFAYSVATARTIASNPAGSFAEEAEGPAGVSCGTTGGGSSGGGPGAATMILGFFLILFLSSLRKSSKNFLS